jgi:hypothetical protein
LCKSSSESRTDGGVGCFDNFQTGGFAENSFQHGTIVLYKPPRLGKKILASYEAGLVGENSVRSAVSNVDDGPLEIVDISTLVQGRQLEFAGNKVDSVAVSPNGYLSFPPHFRCEGPYRSPLCRPFSREGNLLGPFAADWNPLNYRDNSGSSGGSIQSEIRYKVTEEMVSVLFKDMTRFTETPNIAEAKRNTFSAGFFADSSFYWGYHSMTEDVVFGDSVGIFPSLYSSSKFRRNAQKARLGNFTNGVSTFLRDPIVTADYYTSSKFPSDISQSVMVNIGDGAQFVGLYFSNAVITVKEACLARNGILELIGFEETQEVYNFLALNNSAMDDTDRRDVVWKCGFNIPNIGNGTNISKNNTILTFETISGKQVGKCRVPSNADSSPTGTLQEVEIFPVVKDWFHVSPFKAFRTIYQHQSGELTTQPILVRIYEDTLPPQCGCEAVQTHANFKVSECYVCYDYAQPILRENIKDCHGVCFGSAYFDGTGRCVGGTTGITPTLLESELVPVRSGNSLGDILFYLIYFFSIIIALATISRTISLVMRHQRYQRQAHDAMTLGIVLDPDGNPTNAYNGPPSAQRGLNPTEIALIGKMIYSSAEHIKLRKSKSFKDFEDHNPEAKKEPEAEAGLKHSMPNSGYGPLHAEDSPRDSGNTNSMLDEELEKGLKAVPVKSKPGGGDDAKCSICLSDFEVGDQIRVMPTPCSHEFHVPCIDGWLAEKGTCPLCNRQVRTLAGYRGKQPSQDRSFIPAIFSRPQVPQQQAQAHP